MPVAKIEGPKGTVIATVWKKGTRPMLKFFSDPEVPYPLKKKTALKAMGVLAKLHNAGFIHKHAHMGNFVVAKDGSPALVDYTLLKEAPPGRMGRVLLDKEKRDLAFAISEDFGGEIIDQAFEKKLVEEYDRVAKSGRPRGFTNVFANLLAKLKFQR